MFILRIIRNTNSKWRVTDTCSTWDMLLSMGFKELICDNCLLNCIRHNTIVKWLAVDKTVRVRFPTAALKFVFSTTTKPRRSPGYWLPFSADKGTQVKKHQTRMHQSASILVVSGWMTGKDLGLRYIKDKEPISSTPRELQIWCHHDCRRKIEILGEKCAYRHSHVHCAGTDPGHLRWNVSYLTARQKNTPFRNILPNHSKTAEGLGKPLNDFSACLTKVTLSALVANDRNEVISTLLIYSAIIFGTLVLLSYISSNFVSHLFVTQLFRRPHE
jgi:hypothetical protein